MLTWLQIVDNVIAFRYDVRVITLYSPCLRQSLLVQLYMSLARDHVYFKERMTYQQQPTICFLPRGRQVIVESRRLHSRPLLGGEEGSA